MTKDDYNPKLADETRTCCGCGATWTIPCSPVTVEPPHSCGKAECNQKRRQLLKDVENGQ